MSCYASFKNFLINKTIRQGLLTLSNVRFNFFYLTVVIISCCLIFLSFAVIPISPFNLTLPGYTVRTGHPFSIRVSIHEGTNVVYDWNLGDQVVRKVSKTFFYSYSRPGVYNVEVTASNANNSYTNQGVIVVQSPIFGLTCRVNNVAAKPLEEVLIRWFVYSGTVYA